MEAQALLLLTLHHYCCSAQTVSGGKKSTPSDAHNASCNTLTVGGFASRVERKGRELLAVSWKSSAVGSGSEGVD